MKLNNPFVFYCSDDYPNGTIKATKEDLLELVNHGWVVDFHRDYYLNEVSFTLFGVKRSFAGPIFDLGYSETSDSGYIEDIVIKNQEALDVLFDIINNYILFSKLNK